MNAKLILIDPYTIFRDGFRWVLEAETNFKIVTGSDNLDEVMDLAMELKPDLIVGDFDLTSSIEVANLHFLSKIHPNIKKVMLTLSKNEDTVLNALDIGFDGYMLKDMPTDQILHMMEHIKNGGSYIHPEVTHIVVKAFRRLAEGRPASTQLTRKTPFDLLTDREMEVLELVAEGKNNREIADILGISDKTVKNHVNKLMQKLNITNRTEAAIMMIKHNWKLKDL